MKFLNQTILFLLLVSNALAQNTSFQEAENRMAKGEFKKAIILFTQILNQNSYPQEAYYIHLNRANCYYFLGKYEASKNDLDLALKIKRKNKDFKFIKGKSYMLLGRIASKLNQKEKSLKYYYKSAKFHVASDIYNNIGYKEMQLQKYKKALKNLNKAINMDSNNPYAYSNRAFVLLKLNQIQKAKFDIEIALKQIPKNAYAFKHRALIYIEEKEFEKACSDLYKANKLGQIYFKDEADIEEIKTLIERHCKELIKDRT